MYRREKHSMDVYKIFLFLCMFSLLTISAFAALDTNIINYYALENLSNEVGTLDLTIGSGDPTSGVTGIINNAYEFDGVDDSLYYAAEIPGAVNSSAFTINMWVNITASPNFGMLYSTYTAVPNHVEFRIESSAAGIPKFILSNSAGTGYGADAPSGSIIGAGWVMLTTTWDGSEIIVYKNGVAGTPTATTGILTSGLNDFVRFMARTTTTLEVTGRADEIGMWDRALTPTEITELYNSGAGLAYPFSVGPTPSEFFRVYADDDLNATDLTDITVTLDNGSIYTNASSTFVQLPINDSSLQNLTVAVDNYFNVSFLNWNTSYNLLANLTEYPRFSIYDYWNNTQITHLWNVTIASKSFAVNNTGGASYIYIPYNESLTVSYGAYNAVVGYPASIRETRTHDFSNSNDLNASLLTLNVSVEYGNYTTYNGTSYTRMLNYNVTVYGCWNWTTVYLTRYINDSVLDSLNTDITSMCGEGVQNTTISSSYTPTTEGFFNIKFTPENFYYFSQDSWNTPFVGDLNDPTVVFNAEDIVQGFVADYQTDLSLRCIDTVAPYLYYNLTVNDDVLFSGFKVNNATQTNESTLGDGANVAIGTCGDFFTNVSTTTNFTAYARNIAIVDEITGEPYNISNASSLRIWFDDNSSYFDFKANSSYQVGVIGVDETRLRLNIEYANGDIITRYLNLIYMQEDNATICANLDNVQHFEQLAISASSSKPAIIKNQYTNCYIASDFTRFAYEGAFSLPFFTIASIYYLYTFDDGQQVLLSSLDGTLQTLIDLDNLLFSQTEYNVGVSSDPLVFSRYDNDTVLIYYKNYGAGKAAQNLVIYRTDTNTLLSNISSITNPNEFTYYFNWGTLSNINQSTVFKVVLTSTETDGSQTVKTYYFNTEGADGFIPSVIGVVIAMFLIFFGITLTRADFAFGFFGIFIYIAALGVLAFTVSVWYVVFIQVVTAISLLYSVITLFLGNGKRYIS